MSMSPIPPLPEPLVASGTEQSSLQPAAAIAASQKLRTEDAAGGTAHDSSDTQEPFPTLKPGCYLTTYLPISDGRPLVFNQFDGTMRVVHDGDNHTKTISGDLYRRRVALSQPGRVDTGPAPNTSDSVIPIRPRANYAYYIRVTSLGGTITGRVPAPSGVPITFEAWNYDASTATWSLEPSLYCDLILEEGVMGSFFQGDVFPVASGPMMGKLSMNWISSKLRRAVVEIDGAPDCVLPEASVFDSIGWNVTVLKDQRNIAEPEGGVWSDAQMHEAMLQNRRATNLDTEWRYHILSVSHIASTPRGIMYDSGATDSDHLPREGVGIANLWRIPDVQTDPLWGSEGGKLFKDATQLFFRTAVHELGHAFGLYHDTADLGFMNTTDVIAASSTPARPFPSNIKWNYAPNGLRYLRHYPDIYIRPGGTQFGGAKPNNPVVTGDSFFGRSTDIDVPDLSLTVTPLESEVPFGAPVRIRIKLRNDKSSTSTVPVPADISLKSEFVQGTVKKLDGTDARSYRPLIRCVDEGSKLVLLKPGEAVSADLTLLRGGKGALFHSSGIFEISANIRWPLVPVKDTVAVSDDGKAGESQVYATVSASNTVYVTPPENVSQAKAAHKILTCPDAQLVLIMGGDHLTEGINAIQEAAKDEVLGRHYRTVEARRLLNLPRRMKSKNEKDQVNGVNGGGSGGGSGGGGSGSEGVLDHALGLLNKSNLVCSEAERKKLIKLAAGLQEIGEGGEGRSYSFDNTLLGHVLRRLRA